MFESVDKKPSYMIYYGKLSDDIVKIAQKYDIVILHPMAGNITHEQVRKIQSAGTLVFGYISVGEDLRTAGMTSEQMLVDERFVGDGTGPRIDPRADGDESLDNVNPMGIPSTDGGYASYYLDDNDHDGKPDINPNFTCAYTNIGDPSWYDVLNDMTIDGKDGVAGIREILTEDYGRGLGCDGLFLDTLDTCAPNKFTGDDNPARTRFEWTVTGCNSFMARIKGDYPNELICQNRGLFLFNSQMEQYKFTTRGNIDYLMFESYRLDSCTASLYSEVYFPDNKYNYVPKLMAEANRPDGFKVLSLGYAEGPSEYDLYNTLLGKSKVGLAVLLEDIDEAQKQAGFSHYITDASLTMANDFVMEHQDDIDQNPPEWSSVFNDSEDLPAQKPKPRVGIGKAEPVEGGVTVSWDVALDENRVKYRLYYQTEPFDFEADPDLSRAQSVELIPEVGEGYGVDVNEDIYPYQATVKLPESNETYYLVIRARDCSSNHNEEKNTVVREVTLSKSN